MFLDTLNNQSELVTEFDEELWYSTVDSVTVYKDMRMVFTFRDGMKLKSRKVLGKQHKNGPQVFNACGLFVVYMVLIKWNSASFCSSVKVLHFANSARCSSVISAGPFPPRRIALKLYRTLTYRFQGWKRRRIIPVKHICDCGMREFRFFCQPVIRPAALIH